MKRTNIADEQPFALAVERATSWFNVHADQRLKMVNFYLILLGAILAGFAAALENKLFWFELVLSVVLLIVTYCFKKLDCRTAQLVKIAESALREIEKSLAEATGIKEIELAKAAEDKKGIPSYRQTFDKLFFTGGLLGLAGLAYSILTIWGCAKF